MPQALPRPSRSRARTLGFSLLLLVLCGAFLETMAGFALHQAPFLEKLRRQTAQGGSRNTVFQRSVGQSYLNYLPSPGLRGQHNEHGYRGKAVPLDRRPGVLRVLCMGGSTTYGWSVKRPQDAYPAQLEELLRGSPPDGFDDVEVINAGVPWGTTAEMTTHYHFKYHYYQPDLVILHTGLNDAQAFHREHYHPDYSHWRQQMVPRHELPGLARTLTKSRLLGALLIPFVYGTHPEIPTFNRYGTPPPPPVAPWFDVDWPPLLETPADGAKLPRERIAFHHNLKRLIEAVHADGGKVVLMPVRIKPGDEVPGMPSVLFHEQLLLDLAAAEELPVAPFPEDLIPAKHWKDPMHVDAEGCAKKAKHVEPRVREALRSR